MRAHLGHVERILRCFQRTFWSDSTFFKDPVSLTAGTLKGQRHSRKKKPKPCGVWVFLSFRIQLLSNLWWLEVTALNTSRFASKISQIIKAGASHSALSKNVNFIYKRAIG